MHLEKQFEVSRSFEESENLVANDAALVELFPNAETKIVEIQGKRKTTETRYRALGRDGVATFYFDFTDSGCVQFEKVCDGRIWSEFTGEVLMEQTTSGTRVTISMEGRTKPFVPEFTIRTPMQEQIEQMSSALKSYLEESDLGKSEA